MKLSQTARKINTLIQRDSEVFCATLPLCENVADQIVANYKCSLATANEIVAFAKSKQGYQDLEKADYPKYDLFGDACKHSKPTGSFFVADNANRRRSTSQTPRKPRITARGVSSTLRSGNFCMGAS